MVLLSLLHLVSKINHLHLQILDEVEVAVQIQKIIHVLHEVRQNHMIQVNVLKGFLVDVLNLTFNFIHFLSQCLWVLVTEQIIQMKGVFCPILPVLNFVLYRIKKFG